MIKNIIFLETHNTYLQIVLSEAQRKKMTNYQARLTFKPIKENAYEKERERKLEDQAKWTSYFDRIVGSYFDTHTFRGVHKELNIEKDRLDCFVPSPGMFICQQFAKPGTKPTTKNIEEIFVEEPEAQIEDGEPVKSQKVGEQKKNEDQIKVDQVKSEAEGDQNKNEKTGRRKKGIKKTPKNGCGRNWNSNLCLTKFVCWIDKDDSNKLIVELREYGQRCEHCTKKYENPSFKSHVLEIMITWLLVMILEGTYLSYLSYLFIFIYFLLSYLIRVIDSSH